MVKKFVLALVSLIALSGCASNAALDVAYENYRIHYQSILNNPIFVRESNYFNIEATIELLSDGAFRYDIFIDEPRVAMYDVEVLVIVDEGLLVISDQMMPSVGIFEDQTYHLIPFQVNAERGFYRGFNLNGVVQREPIDLKILVMWKDYFKIRNFREYVAFELSTRPPIDEVETEPEEDLDNTNE
jgi:hypothetical protein